MAMSPFGEKMQTCEKKKSENTIKTYQEKSHKNWIIQETEKSLEIFFKKIKNQF